MKFEIGFLSCINVHDVDVDRTPRIKIFFYLTHDAVNQTASHYIQ